MKEDLALLSTGDLEKAARHPRSREDARAIAEELASRRGCYNDNTPSLFGTEANSALAGARKSQRSFDKLRMTTGEEK